LGFSLDGEVAGELLVSRRLLKNVAKVNRILFLLCRYVDQITSDTELSAVSVEGRDIRLAPYI
jgi:hypothetical protein